MKRSLSTAMAGIYLSISIRSAVSARRAQSLFVAKRALRRVVARESIAPRETRERWDLDRFGSLRNRACE